MNEIGEINKEGEIATKLNEVIRAVNNLKCVGEKVSEEVPIYETLSHNDALIISKDEDGVLVARNRLGDVQLERVKYPEGTDRGE